MEKRPPKVAVIVPAYNAQDFIEQSVKSILSQTFRDFELIVVNDGSKDDTEQILLRLAEEDSRLRPITTENNGPAIARNKGLDAVKAGTEYVMFVDSDDWILPDTLEYLLDGAKTGADLVIHGFTIVAVDGSKTHYWEPEQLIQRDQFGTAFPLLYKANILNGAVTKLYKTQILEKHGIRFRDYRWGEDRMFVFDYLEKIQSIQVLPQCKYHYIMHKGESLITKFYDKKLQVCLESDTQVEVLCEKLGVTDDNVCKYMFAKSIFSCITNLYSPSCKLTFAQRWNYVRELSRNDHILRRCRNIRAGLPTTVLCMVIRSRQPWLILPVFWAVALAGKKLPALFMKLKHRK